MHKKQKINKHENDLIWESYQQEGALSDAAKWVRDKATDRNTYRKIGKTARKAVDAFDDPDTYKKIGGFFKPVKDRWNDVKDGWSNDVSDIKPEPTPEPEPEPTPEPEPEPTPEPEPEPTPEPEPEPSPEPEPEPEDETPSFADYSKDSDQSKSFEKQLRIKYGNEIGELIVKTNKLPVKQYGTTLDLIRDKHKQAIDHIESKLKEIKTAKYFEPHTGGLVQLHKQLKATYDSYQSFGQDLLMGLFSNVDSDATVSDAHGVVSMISNGHGEHIPEDHLQSLGLSKDHVEKLTRVVTGAHEREEKFSKMMRLAYEYKDKEPIFLVRRSPTNTVDSIIEGPSHPDARQVAPDKLTLLPSEIKSDKISLAKIAYHSGINQRPTYSKQILEWMGNELAELKMSHDSMNLDPQGLFHPIKLWMELWKQDDWAERGKEPNDLHMAWTTSDSFKRIISTSAFKSLQAVNNK